MQNNISIKQNEVKMLKVQFAARIFYNKAENLSYLAFIISVLLVFVIFIPETYSVLITKFFPILMEVLCIIIIKKRNKLIIKAAQLRNYFDNYVFNIKFEKYSDTLIREIYEIAEKNYQLRMNEFSIQSQNNGDCELPGVLDWYIINEDISQIDAIYECQKQNIWWSKNMEKFRFQLYFLIIIFVILILAMIFFYKGLFVMLISFFAIFSLLSTLINDWFKYMILAHKISGVVAILDLYRNEAGVLILQEYLAEIREFNLLHINQFHKKNAKFLTKLYKEIVQQI